VVGANVHVYLRNDGASAVSVSDVTLAGYSLNRILRAKQVGDHLPLRSIYHYWDNPPQDIFDAGEPVWYKADPSTIPPGGVAQVVVRLRFVPVIQPVSLGIVTSAGTLLAAIPVEADSPQLASVSFAPDLKTVYLHWRRATGLSGRDSDGRQRRDSGRDHGDPTLNGDRPAVRRAAPAMSYHVPGCLRRREQGHRIDQGLGQPLTAPGGRSHSLIPTSPGHAPGSTTPPTAASTR
jgi:hypothetical protein